MVIVTIIFCCDYVWKGKFVTLETRGIVLVLRLWSAWESCCVSWCLLSRHYHGHCFKVHRCWWM